MKEKSKQKNKTMDNLVLILVVVVIFAILSSMLLPALGSAREKARTIARSQDSNYIENTEFDDFNTESYDYVKEHEFKKTIDNPLSTFSIDVDTASYSNIRRLINMSKQPPIGAVRIEEMINYFNYSYPNLRNGNQPFSTRLDLGPCPWNNKNKLLRIAIKGKEIPKNERKPANLVFLIDVSGSMYDYNKLPLLKKSLKMLVNNLNENDTVSLVVYASNTGIVLDPTPCSQKHKILNALSELEAGGSTNGGSGIKLAYKIAQKNYIKNGINRVILCTDGDFNVGISNQSALVKLIKKSAKNNVFLSVLGFGMGNYKNSILEKLADNGNGNYGYIDTKAEAQKLLVEQINGTLATIAKDVKIQVNFNPAKIKAYRLIGYENRLLNKEDFHDDTKDAGEIGAGHTVTAFYELIPHEANIKLPKVDGSKYTEVKIKATANNAEVANVKIRYKDSESEKSKLLTFNTTQLLAVATAFPDNEFRFATAVIEYGMLLKNSKFKGNSSFQSIFELANKPQKPARKEFLKLVAKTQKLID